jgi:hypothetical protein
LDGATSRSLHDKLSEIVSVKDFGATGNGYVDDTEAIQAAINAAAGIGGSVDGHYGGAVFFPPGEYLTRTITLDERHFGIRLFGVMPNKDSINHRDSSDRRDLPNNGSWLKLKADQNTDMLLIHNNSKDKHSIVIHDLGFNGNYQQQNLRTCVDNKASCIKLKGANTVFIDRCMIYGAGYAGVGSEKSVVGNVANAISLSNCFINDCAMYGIDASQMADSVIGNGTYISFSGRRMYRTTGRKGAGIFYRTGDVLFTDMHIAESFGQNIRCNGAKSGVFDNLRLDGSTGENIKLIGCKHLQFNDIHAYDAGVQLWDLFESDLTKAGICRGSIKTIGEGAEDFQEYGFRVEGSANTLTGCISESNNMDGFYVKGHGNVFEGCEARSNGRHGFHINDGDSHVLKNSRVFANANTGIRISADDCIIDSCHAIEFGPDVNTTLAAPAVAGRRVISVSNTAGISTGDVLHIKLNKLRLIESVLVKAINGTLLTLSLPLEGSGPVADSGNAVKGRLTTKGLDIPAPASTGRTITGTRVYNLVAYNNTIAQFTDSGTGTQTQNNVTS